MKLKFIVPLLAIVLIFAFSGCGDDVIENLTPNNNTTSSSSSNASVISSDMTPSTQSQGSYASDLTSSEGFISAEKAKDIALNHAGIASDKIYNYEIELDRDYNEISYEISFDSDGYEFDYDIDARSGSIIKSEKEKDY